MAELQIRGHICDCLLQDIIFILHFTLSINSYMWHTFACGLRYNWTYTYTAECMTFRKRTALCYGLCNTSQCTKFAICWTFVTDEWNDIDRKKMFACIKATLNYIIECESQCCRQNVDEPQWMGHANTARWPLHPPPSQNKEHWFTILLFTKLNVLVQSLVVPQFMVFVGVLSVQRPGFYVRDLWWRSREACVRFMVKN